MTPNEPNPVNETETQQPEIVPNPGTPATNVNPGRAKTSRTQPKRDWTPLGSVRDYFTEQMRQDSIFRA